MINMNIVRIWLICSLLLHHTLSVTTLSHFITTLHFNSYYSTSFTDLEIVHLQLSSDIIECFSQPLGFLEKCIIFLFQYILYVSHSFSIYSCSLYFCSLSFKNQTSFPLSHSLNFLMQFLPWKLLPSLEIGTTEGMGGTAHKLRLKSYLDTV